MTAPDAVLHDSGYRRHNLLSKTMNHSAHCDQNMGLADRVNRRFVELVRVELEHTLERLRSRLRSSRRTARRIDKIMTTANLRTREDALRLVYQVKDVQQKLRCDSIVAQQLGHAVGFYLHTLQRTGADDGEPDDCSTKATNMLDAVFAVERDTQQTVTEWIDAIVVASLTPPGRAPRM